MSGGNKTQRSRLELLDGKTEITDEEIIALLDLPVEKRSKNPEIFTDKSYKELKDNPAELEKLAANLKTEPEYLKYHSTYIAKSKLLYQESSVLYNEIPCLIILDKMNVPAYLLPYEYAKDKNGNNVAFADSLKSDVFTDFKRVFNKNLRHPLDKGSKQGRNIFFLINNESIDYKKLRKQLEDFVNSRKSENKEAEYLFFSEKDYVCYSFAVNEKGFIKENPPYDLKQIRLANVDKPLTPNQKTDIASVSSSDSDNVTQENSVVNNKYENEVFNSLLLRGEIVSLEILKDIENRTQRYFDAVTSLENLNPLIQSETIKESNSIFVKNQKESRFYKDVQNLFVENTNKTRENKMEKYFETQEYWKNEFIKDNAETFKALEDYLEKGIRPKGEIFSFSKTPEISQFIGIPNNEIIFSTKVLNKARNTHHLSNAEIKSVFENFASPVFIFKSDTSATENKENSMLYITNSFAISKKPLALTLNIDSDAERNRKKITVNEIRSVHDRTLIARNGTDLIQKWINDGLCRYVDDKKISEWQLAAGEQFPLAVLQSDKNNIKTFSNFVNNQLLDAALEDKSSIKNTKQNEENKSMKEKQNNAVSDFNMAEEHYISIDENGNPHTFTEKEATTEEELEIIEDTKRKNAINELMSKTSSIWNSQSKDWQNTARNFDRAIISEDYEEAATMFSSMENDKPFNEYVELWKQALYMRDGNQSKLERFENYQTINTKKLSKENKIMEETLGLDIGTVNEDKRTVAENMDNPFIKAEPEDIKNLYKQAESVEKMQQEAAEKAELDESGNVVFPREENASVQPKEPLPKWKETLSNLMNMAKDEEEKENTEEKIKMQNSIKQPNPNIVQKEARASDSKLPKVSVKSYVSGQEFTGQNPSRTQSLRRELVEDGTIKPDDDFVLVSEEQLKSAGCNSKDDAKSVSILCPPDEKNPEFHNEKYFHVSAVDDIEKLNAFYNSKEIESISENPADYMETSEDVADFGWENDPNYLAWEEMNKSYNEYLETEEGKKQLEKEAEAVAAELRGEANVPPVLSADALKHKNFVEHAYEAGTKVPSFGYRNSQSGHTVILEGWEFCKTEDFATNAATDSYMNSIRSEFIEDKDGNKVKNPNYNPYKYKDNGQTVVLSKLQKETNPETGLVDEKRIYLRISAAEYNAQIENSCLLKDCAQITEDVKQEYLQKAHLDENEQRPNNSGNFTHNFNAYCRKGANNVREAMDFGKRLIQNMRPEEREKLKTQMLKWEKLTGKSYTQRLAEEYKENVSDRPINDKTAFTKETLDAIRYNTETISHKGAPLDKSCRMKVGDTIKMKITVPDCLGRRNRKLPIQTLELVSHSPDGNSVVLMDEKHLSKYVIPRDDFIKTVQKQERKQMKAERRADRKAAVSMSD